jgi:hypothetical protein
VGRTQFDHPEIVAARTLAEIVLALASNAPCGARLLLLTSLETDSDHRPRGRAYPAARIFRRGPARAHTSTRGGRLCPQQRRARRGDEAFPSAPTSTVKERPSRITRKASKLGIKDLQLAKNPGQTGWSSRPDPSGPVVPAHDRVVDPPSDTATISGAF